MRFICKLHRCREGRKRCAAAFRGKQGLTAFHLVWHKHLLSCMSSPGDQDRQDKLPPVTQHHWEVAADSTEFWAARPSPWPFLLVLLETQLPLLSAEPSSGQAADGGHPHAGRHPSVTPLRSDAL